MTDTASVIDAMSKQSPTSRTLQELKQLGFTAGVVEQTVRGKGIVFKRDYLNCIDIIAVREGIGILGIQATSNNGGNHAARKAKALATPALRNWLESGGRFEIWSWAKQGARGERKTWQKRREEIRLDDLPAPAEEVTGG